jgi:putative endonuclease
MATPGALGQRAESIARRYLRRRGLKILAKNVRFRFGEIDIVAMEGQCVVFVEVRARRSPAYGGAADSVDHRKQRKLAMAASAFLTGHPELATRPCRFDVMALTPDGILWLRDAFRTD